MLQEPSLWPSLPALNITNDFHIMVWQWALQAAICTEVRELSEGVLIQLDAHLDAISSFMSLATLSSTWPECLLGDSVSRSVVDS